MQTSFSRFTIAMPKIAALDCSHAGACDADVQYYASMLKRPTDCTSDALHAELSEHGAWDEEQLADDDANWARIVWIAACNIREERCKRHPR